MKPLEAWCLRRARLGRPLNGELAGASAPVRELCGRMATAAPHEKELILDAYLLGSGAADATLDDMLAIDADGPPPGPDEKGPPKRFATCADVLDAASGIPWAWERWIPRSAVVGVAGAEGSGKTRFALDLARRVWHGLPWPDGSPMALPPNSPTVWLCADGQQGELAATLKDYNMPPEAVVFPTPFDDPCGGDSLDENGTVEAFGAACRIHKAAFGVIDSLTFATSRRLHDQSEIASLRPSLVGLAQENAVPLFVLLHVAKDGQALGRRVKGLTRTLLHLEAADPDKPTRLRLWVEKTFAQRPDPLGATIGTGGCTYDANPPARASANGQPTDKLGAAKAFIVERLSDGDQRAVDVVNAWLSRGESKGTLFRAKDALVEDGRLVVDDSRKPQIWHLVKDADDGETAS